MGEGEESAGRRAAAGGFFFQPFDHAPQFAEGDRFDLADAFASDAVLVADLLEG